MLRLGVSFTEGVEGHPACDVQDHKVVGVNRSGWRKDLPDQATSAETSTTKRLKAGQPDRVLVHAEPVQKARADFLRPRMIPGLPLQVSCELQGSLLLRRGGEGLTKALRQSVGRRKP